MVTPRSICCWLVHARQGNSHYASLGVNNLNSYPCSAIILRFRGKMMATVFSPSTPSQLPLPPQSLESSRIIRKHQLIMRVLAAFLLLSRAAAATALIYDALFPREEPMVTRDPRECNFLNLHPYFSGPTPTGALETALISYGDELNKDCPWTDRDVMGLRICPYPAQLVWCAFSKSAPASVLPAWSAHGSEAASWWGKHSSEIVEYA